MAKTKSTNSFRPYFIDLVVVIAGISIAFALDNWSQNNKESKQEELYLQALKEDLISDQQNLHILMDSSKVLINNINETFQLLFSNQSIDRFENRHIISTYVAPYFSGNNGTYNALINSGDLKSISSFEVKKGLADHYNVSYAEIRNVDEFIRNLVDNHLYPYMLKNIRFAGREGIADAAPLRQNEAINLMGSYMNFLNSRNKRYQELSAQCSILIDKIDNQLK